MTDECKKVFHSNQVSQLLFSSHILEKVSLKGLTSLLEYRLVYSHDDFFILSFFNLKKIPVVSTKLVSVSDG